MSDRRLEDRLARHAATMPVQEPDGHDRLRRALLHLERGGVTGSHAYAPVFRSLARAGIIVPPLHYWSLPGLTAFAFVMLTVLVGCAAMIAVATGHPPVAVRAMIGAGPLVFVAVMLALSVGFAWLHHRKAQRIGLPLWRDL